MTAKIKLRIWRILYAAACGPVIAFWIAIWILSLTEPRMMKGAFALPPQATALVRQK